MASCSCCSLSFSLCSLWSSRQMKCSLCAEREPLIWACWPLDSICWCAIIWQCCCCFGDRWLCCCDCCKCCWCCGWECGTTAWSPTRVGATVCRCLAVNRNMMEFYIMMKLKTQIIATVFDLTYVCVSVLSNYCSSPIKTKWHIRLKRTKCFAKFFEFCVIYACSCCRTEPAQGNVIRRWRCICRTWLCCRRTENLSVYISVLYKTCFIKIYCFNHTIQIDNDHLYKKCNVKKNKSYRVVCAYPYTHYLLNIHLVWWTRIIEGGIEPRNIYI